jgi:hypothetical protein
VEAAEGRSEVLREQTHRECDLNGIVYEFLCLPGQP